MRTLFLLLGLTLVACTTQPAGARCEQDVDCDTAGNQRCRQEIRPDSPCMGGSCICCPTDRASAANVPGCALTNVTVDAGHD